MNKRYVRIFVFLAAFLCLLPLWGCEENVSKEEPYSFTVDGVTLTPGAKAKDALAALAGRNPVVSVGKSCLGGVDGEDVNYVYAGFHVQTFRQSEGHPDEEIRWVILDDDSVATDQGITIGAEASAVKAAYGAPATESDSLLLYQRGKTTLRFGVREGRVVSVSFTVAE
ncbi:MAG: hypothetical protein E7620_09185 [Ruminococcaceae bacterium]|nr:hypothetical protein [Oscillospiraceae bacterium]